MKLKNVQVTCFKNIRRPCQFDVDSITCLIGKNESGKTALLEGLYRLNPLIPAHGFFNLDDDYPRIDVEDYRLEVAEGRREPAVVTRARFQLEEAELQELEKDFPGVLAKPELTLSKGYTNELFAELLVDEKAAVAVLLAKAGLGAQTMKALSRCSSLGELAGSLKGLEREKEASALSSLLSEIQKDGLLDYLYRNYLVAKVPKFLYFSEFYQLQGQVNLQALAKRLEADQLLASDYPLLGLIDLARMNLDEISNPRRALERDNRLEGASNHLTKRLMKYWSQNRHLEIRFDIRPGLPKDPEGMQEGTNLWAHVYNSRQRVRTLLGQRSKGFVWFFSFLAWFTQQEKRKTPLVLLLDEPGLHLHGSAQRDLLRFLEDESKSGHQVLFTTQSPFMVSPEHWERVRIVEDSGAEADEASLAEGSGTRVFADALAAERESLLPLRAALGYRLSENLFPDRHCLAVGGVADLLYLQTMYSLLAGLARESLSSRWTITPIGGARNLPSFASLLGQRAEQQVTTLLGTGDLQGQEEVELSLRSALGDFFRYSEFTRSSEADIEDLFEVDFYLNLVNAAYRDLLAKPLAKGQLRGSSVRVVELVDQAAKALDPKIPFERCGPARYFAANSSGLKGQISKETFSRFEKIAVALNALLRG